MLNIFMASLDPQIKSPPFFMPPGHFTLDQMYGLKINDYQLLFFFLQAYGREADYCPSLDLRANNLSDQRLLLLLSRFSCVQLCATQETAAHQAPLSLGFSKQEYWSGVPLTSPDRDLWP